MKKISVLIAICFFLLETWIPCFAAEQRVFDEAGLFTQQEQQQLETEIQTAKETATIDLVVLTITDAEGKTAEAYADDFYDENGFGVGSDYSGALLLIDMDHREVWISTCGKAINYLTDSRIEALLDDIYNDLVDANYYDAAVTFLNGVQRYVQQGVPKDQYQYNRDTGEITKYKEGLTVNKVITYLIVSLLFGGICVGCVAFSYRKKAPSNVYPFQEKSDLHITNSHENLVSHFVTHRRIPRNTGGSSGGSSRRSRSTTHTSSSGRSHGGGGRKF